MVNKKKKLHNGDLIQQDEGRHDGETIGKDVIQQARAAGINLSPILEHIMSAVKNVDSSNPDGVCTDSDVEQFRRVLIEKVQKILNKYQMNRIEIGRYPDSYAMNGYAEVQIFLASSGRPYEEYHDGRTQDIELSSYVLEAIHSPKHILNNLFATLIEMTEKNKTKIKEIEEFANP